MKHLSIMSLFLLISVLSINAADEGRHLFILSGQSNMAGFNHWKLFTPIVATEFGKQNVIVVRDAQGGQPIRRWYREWKSAQGEKPEVTGDLYDRLMNKVNPAIEGKKILTVTFIWMQGESDAKKDGEVYGTSLRGLLEQIKKDLNRPDMNTVIGRISDHSSKKRPHWELIRKAQVEVAESDPRGAWIDTDDLNDGKINKAGQERINDIHYSKEGYKILGERFAQKAIELIKKQAQ